MPSPPSPPTRTIIRGPWGEQTLTLPVLGGRKKLLSTPYSALQLSSHGNWPHTHWQAITSAYGSLPYFHYYEDTLAEIYSHPPRLLKDFCRALHHKFLELSSLHELLDWLKEHPREFRAPADSHLFPEHIAAIELLFARGPESIFYLLTSCKSLQ